MLRIGANFALLSLPSLRAIQRPVAAASLELLRRATSLEPRQRYPSTLIRNTARSRHSTSPSPFQNRALQLPANLANFPTSEPNTTKAKQSAASSTAVSSPAFRISSLLAHQRRHN
ncbi:hypothetical protein IWZ01DRAFT_505044 [Phyllosticta capitalensis]